MLFLIGLGLYLLNKKVRLLRAFLITGNLREKNRGGVKEPIFHLRLCHANVNPLTVILRAAVMCSGNVRGLISLQMMSLKWHLGSACYFPKNMLTLISL